MGAWHFKQFVRFSIVPKFGAYGMRLSECVAAHADIDHHTYGQHH